MVARRSESVGHGGHYREAPTGKWPAYEIRRPWAIGIVVVFVGWVLLGLLWASIGFDTHVALLVVGAPVALGLGCVFRGKQGRHT